MLLCDGCSHGFHTHCLTPPLKSIPEGDWYCLRCAELGAAALKLDEHKAQKVFREWYDTESVFKGQWSMFACEAAATDSHKVWRMQYTTSPHSGGPHICSVRFRTNWTADDWLWTVESCDLVKETTLAKLPRSRKIYYGYTLKHVVVGVDGKAKTGADRIPSSRAAGERAHGSGGRAGAKRRPVSTKVSSGEEGDANGTSLIKMCEDCSLKRPSYGMRGEGKKRWCAGCGKANHAGSEQLQKEKMCEDCEVKRPSYGIRKEGKKRWCAGCGKKQHAGAVRLQKMCEDCDSKVPSYGIRPTAAEGEGSPYGGKMRWCDTCAVAGHPDAIYLLHLKQICEDCEVKRAHYGMPAEGQKRWCAGCGKRGHPGAQSLRVGGGAAEGNDVSHEDELLSTESFGHVPPAALPARVSSYIAPITGDRSLGAGGGGAGVP